LTGGLGCGIRGLLERKEEEMKRKEFKVLINGEVKTTKFAFNAARREIPNLIREFGHAGETWILSDEQQTLEGPNRVATDMFWKRESDGYVILCSVRKV
jgi:hypothetical protein